MSTHPLSAMPSARAGGAGADFADLSRLVRRTGLLDRRHAYYAGKIALTVLALAGGCVAFVVVGDSWWQLGTAVFFAVMFAQLAFLGHDAGHKQIFRTRRANDRVGYTLGGVIGVSYGWWMGKHTRHHANPNHEDQDPDLAIPILAFTRGQARNRRGFVRWTAKHQAVLFFPLLLLEGLSLHWASIKAVWHGEVRARRLEAVLLLAHVVVYLAAVFLVLSPPVAIAFIAVHQGLWVCTWVARSLRDTRVCPPTPTPARSTSCANRSLPAAMSVAAGGSTWRSVG